MKICSIIDSLARRVEYIEMFALYVNSCYQIEFVASPVCIRMKLKEKSLLLSLVGYIRKENEEIEIYLVL
jgi:hypothetical protein